MKKYRLTILPGDGIGPEVIASAIKIMDKAAKANDVVLDYREVMVGGIAIDSVGEPLPDITIESCRLANAILFGTVGGSKWDSQPRKLRPEYAIIGLRKALGLHTYIRPCKVDLSLAGISPLRREITYRNIDFILVRELLGIDSFLSNSKNMASGGNINENNSLAYDVLHYTEEQIHNFAVNTFEMARKTKRNKLTSIDKANVLASSMIWRKVFNDLAKEYQDIEVEFLYIDNAIHQLIKHPEKFDIVVTDNLAGDFISETAGAIVGSPALASAASLGNAGVPGIFGGIHGSAEHLAGQDVCNPIATILSSALLMRYGLNEERIATQIENAVTKTLQQGYRTVDILSDYSNIDEYKLVGTTAMTEAILKNL